ncbi:DUF2510 domain-containing protein [Homoserinibacter sp. GY 40078]|uniref:DUF2510 domain-containing protein n=1 Tax=Homoserinibacter sp. GY 40078 TaxID=2603275 RepID=UPI0011CC0500|nr:DUF2510 domain-containing protein [Homoserinibacter sp. GY 40078]TXK17340.1 DUF2510 domain-containing protein [Homoserinibacter sp. GY 40078]
MTDQATRVVPAGWYEDPSDGSRVRWWNGIAWTDHTQQKPELHAAAETLALEASYAASTDAPLVRPRERAVIAATASSWMLGFSPLLFALAFVAAVALGAYVTSSPLVYATLAVPYLAGILWAMLDRRRLRTLGLRGPSVVWSLLGPLVYLIARRARVAGWGQLVTHLLLLAAAGAVAAVGLMTDAAKPLAFGLQVQTELREEFVDSGDATSLTCPAITESLAIGTLYTCQVTMADGTERVLWVSIDSADLDYSYALAL